MNNVVLIGNIGNDLEVKVSVNGKSYIKFNLAVKDVFDKNKTNWIPCTAFNKTAELLDQYCSKGSKIAVMGSWNVNQTEKDSKKITYHSVSVNQVEFLDNKKTSNSENTEDAKENDEFPF